MAVVVLDAAKRQLVVATSGLPALPDLLPRDELPPPPHGRRPVGGVASKSVEQLHGKRRHRSGSRGKYGCVMLLGVDIRRRQHLRPIVAQ